MEAQGALGVVHPNLSSSKDVRGLQPSIRNVNYIWPTFISIAGFWSGMAGGGLLGYLLGGGNRGGYYNGYGYQRWGVRSVSFLLLSFSLEIECIFFCQRSWLYRLKICFCFQFWYLLLFSLFHWLDIVPMAAEECVLEEEGEWEWVAAAAVVFVKLLALVAPEGGKLCSLWNCSFLGSEFVLYFQYKK